MGRWLVGLIGIGLAIPVLGVLGLAVVTPLTPSGAAYVTAAALVAGGLSAVLWRARTGAFLALLGALVAVTVAGSRLAQARRSAVGPLQARVLPAASGTRWFSYLVDEQDLLLFGEALLRLMGAASAREHAGLASAVSAGYAELRAAQNSIASPVISTYLFWQRPGAFDAVIVAPEGSGPPTTGVVFLHGFAGNVSLQCWQIAQAARPLGMVTVCPSTDWVGAWWRPAGVAALRATLDYLREQGVQRFYLGGFSNGGFGLSRLAPGLAGEPGLEGLFFVAGVTNSRDIDATGLPVLILQGAQDERVRAPDARQVAAEIGRAAYVELEADHFLIVKQAEAVQAELRAWLETLDGE